MKNKKSIETILSVLLGNFILAACVAGFILPNGFVMGGVTGFALTITHYIPNLELSAMVFAFNGILFVIGAWQFGKKFALNTAISSVCYPLFLKICSSMPFFQNLTENPLLATIYSGMFIGVGIGLILKVGASTGGTDILALVVHKFTHSPIAMCMYGVDFSVIALQMFFSNTEQVLFGVLMLILTTIALNKVSVLGQSQIQLFIISSKYKEIKNALLNDMVVGATMIKIATAFKNEEQEGVLCIIPKRKLFAVNELIQRIDPQAFMTITQINEVKGRGFSLDREFKSSDTIQ